MPKLEVQQILERVNFSPEYEGLADGIEFDRRLGFLWTPEDLTWTRRNAGWAALKTFVGFVDSEWQQGGKNGVAERFEPLADWEELEPELRTLDRQGEGIGARAYNTGLALDGTAEKPEIVGLYAFEAAPSRIVDYRRAGDRTWLGKRRREAQHLVRQGAGVLLGEHRVVDRASQKHIGADAILYYQTPSAERERKKGTQPASPIPEELMIVRKRTTFQLLGTYERQ